MDGNTPVAGRRRPVETTKTENLGTTLGDMSNADAMFATCNITREMSFDKSYAEAEADLIRFVEAQISAMNDNLELTGKDVVMFEDLNKSLMDYESILLGLESMHADCRIQQAIAQENYDNFYAEKYWECKKELSTLDTKKAAGQKETEMYLRNKYINELATLRADTLNKENKYNFINHLIEDWKNYQFVLGTLSKNAQAEYMADKIAKEHPKEFGDEDSQYGG